MALRMILVGLVASLGFEPPSMSRIENWGHTGRDWVVARVADLTAMTSGPVLAEVDEVPASETTIETAAVEPKAPAPVAVDDLTFEVVVEGMAAQFGDELAMVAPSPTEVVAAAPETEPVVADVVDPATEPVVVADAIVTEPVEAELPFVAPDPTPAPVATLTEIDAPAEGRSLHRLTHAVTLTRQAMAAWASLIDGPVGGVVASRAMAH